MDLSIWSFSVVPCFASASTFSLPSTGCSGRQSNAEWLHDFCKGKQERQMGHSAQCHYLFQGPAGRIRHQSGRIISWLVFTALFVRSLSVHWSFCPQLLYLSTILYLSITDLSTNYYSICSLFYLWTSVFFCPLFSTSTTPLSAYCSICPLLFYLPTTALFSSFSICALLFYLSTINVSTTALHDMGISAQIYICPQHYMSSALSDHSSIFPLLYL